MAKLAGRGALRKWLCFFLIGSAAVCAAAPQNFNSVRRNNGTTTVLRKGECVVAIKVEFGDKKGRSTPPKAVKNLSTHLKGPNLRMTCFAKSFDQDSLLECQNAAEESCALGQFVYEVPEENKHEMQEALEHWSTPNISLFINCLKRDSDKGSSEFENAGRLRRGIKCHGGIEMQFERSLANSYPRIRLELLSDKTRQTKEPWYNGSLLARDLAQDGILMRWSESVLVDCEDDTEEHLLFALAASPEMCPTPEVEEMQRSGYISPILMGNSCTVKEKPVEESEEEAESPNAKSPKAEAELYFFEGEAGALRSPTGKLPLLPHEVISVKPLTHQEIYPFLGALPPRSGPFFEHSKRYHVKLQNRSKIRRKVKVLSSSKNEPKETSNVGLTTLECRCGRNIAILKKCFKTPNKETAPFYVSARSTDQLRWSIHQILGKQEEGSKYRHSEIGKYYKFIIEGPWKPQSVFDPERPVTGRFKWIKRLYRKMKKFFGRGPKLRPEILHLNPALFYSYRNLNASIIQYVHGGETKFCYEKFEIQFSLYYWNFTAEWSDINVHSKKNLFPSYPNQRITMVHDLVGPLFFNSEKKELNNYLQQMLDKKYDSISLTKVPTKNAPERPEDAQITWRCGNGGLEEATESKVSVSFIRVINLRSTQIYDFSPPSYELLR